MVLYEVCTGVQGIESNFFGFFLFSNIRPLQITLSHHWLFWLGEDWAQTENQGEFFVGRLQVTLVLDCSRKNDRIYFIYCIERLAVFPP